jgi:hypothetical protein
MAVGDTLPVYGSSSGASNVHRVRSKRMLYISAVCAVLMVSAVIALTSAARGTGSTLVTAQAPAKPALAGKVVPPAAVANAGKPAPADSDSINFEAAKKLADEYVAQIKTLESSMAANQDCGSVHAIASQLESYIAAPPQQADFEKMVNSIKAAVLKESAYSYLEHVHKQSMESVFDTLEKSSAKCTAGAAHVAPEDSAVETEREAVEAKIDSAEQAREDLVKHEATAEAAVVAHDDHVHNEVITAQEILRLKNMQNHHIIQEEALSKIVADERKQIAAEESKIYEEALQQKHDQAVEQQLRENLIEEEKKVNHEINMENLLKTEEAALEKQQPPVAAAAHPAAPAKPVAPVHH